MLQVVKQHLTKSKLGVHVIPGFATIKKDLSPLISLIDVVRWHRIVQKQILRTPYRFCKEQRKSGVWGIDDESYGDSRYFG